MKHIPFALLIIAIIIFAGRLAVNAMGIMPSQPQVLACQSDWQRLCPAYPKDQISQIKACLEAHKPQLSKLCGELFPK